MSEQARYARWNGVGEPFTFHEVPLPERDVVRIDLATVCGSDLHTVHGRRPAPAPSVLGHEQVGTALTGEHAGRRVVWSLTASCGECDRCVSGRTPKCRHVRKYGHEPFDPAHPLTGGFATHCVLMPGTTVVPVPDDLPDEVAAPAACATATVAAVVSAARGIRPGARVLVTGAGMLGLTAAAMLAERGAHVLVADPDPGRREQALEFGAAEVAAEVTGEVDVALELSGATAAVTSALSALTVGGTLVLAGTVTPGPPVAIDPERIVRSWQTVTGVHNYGPGDLRTAVDFLAAHHRGYPFARLVAPALPLDRIDAAFGGRAARQAIRP